jgi:hypothetical protein
MTRQIEEFPLIPERRDEYIKKFLSAADGKASCRVLDELEIMLKER